MALSRFALGVVHTASAALTLLAVPAGLRAQAAAAHDAGGAESMMMGDAPGSGHKRHMRFTELRPATEADSARALALVRSLRQAIAPYADLDSARAAGYRIRPKVAAMLPRKAIVHMGNPRLQAGGDGAFDPAHPRALLYRHDAAGTLRLAGAMYVAPEGATLDELDARVPLGLAHWHQHVNVCVPRSRDAQIRALRRAETPEDCARAGGRFRAASRYMVHVMIDGGDNLAEAFPQGAEGEGGQEGMTMDQ
jgi:hypothetical protein